MMRELLENSLSGTSYDIAKVVHYCCKDRYVCGRLKNKLWFHFDGKRWNHTEIGPMHEISTEVFERYEPFLEELTIEYEKTRSANGAVTLEQEQLLKVLESKISKVVTTMSKLKNVHSKEAICRECLYLFYDPEFVGKLDNKAHIIPFRDGVFDVTTKEFRPYERDDFMILYIDEDIETARANMNTDEFAQKMQAFQDYRNDILVKRMPRSLFKTRSFA